MSGARATPRDPVARLEPWIAARLLPLDAPAAPVAASDYDLNAGMARPPGPLAEAAVLVALVEREAGLTVLLTRRADTLRRHTGQVAFPGGRAEPGETSAETALREAQEEVGLDPCRVRLAGRGDAYETVTGFRVTPVVGFVSPGAALSPDPREVAEVFEPPFAWLMDVANHQLQQAPAPDGALRSFYAMPWEGRFIWGATARMLRGLQQRLFGEAG